MKYYVVSVPVIEYQTFRVSRAQAETAEEARDLVRRGKVEPLGPCRARGEVLEGREWPVEEEVSADAVSVDLRWSLWSRDRGHWDEFSPGLWGRLEAMEVGDQLTVATAPRTKIGFGTVRAERTKEGWRAEYTFRTKWDDVETLVTTLDVPLEDLDAFAESVPRTRGWTPGVELHGVAEEATVAELMVAVDRAEGTLLETDTKAWAALERKWKKA